MRARRHRRGNVPRAAGQATTEYVLMAVTVAIAIAGASLYCMRGIQASIRMAADQIGDQEDGIRSESGDRLNDLNPEGRTLVRETSTSTSEQNVHIQIFGMGDWDTLIDDESVTRGHLAHRGPNVAGYSRTVVNVE